MDDIILGDLMEAGLDEVVSAGEDMAAGMGHAAAGVGETFAGGVVQIASGVVYAVGATDTAETMHKDAAVPLSRAGVAQFGEAGESFKEAFKDIHHQD